jgi:general L-amino acid transport system permease protein
MQADTPPKKNNWSWRSQAFRGLIYQLLAVMAIVGVVWFLAHNTLLNMRVRGIQSGFDFLTQAAGFDIGESLYPFDSEQPYWQAFLVGVTNTLRVAVLGIILATILGTLLGVGRFSRNALVRGLCLAYVEFFRNIPVLLQLLMWYVVLTEVLPAATEAWQAGGFFLSKGGLNYPIPVWAVGQLGAAIGVLVGAVGVWLYRRWAVRKFEATGKLSSMFWTPLVIIVACSLLGWALGGAPTELNRPVKGEFSIEHGGALTPEFLAVLIGLTLYTAAFMAEVVRGGIQSVPRGQGEAAAALGLSRHQRCAGDAAAGAARDHSAPDQPVPEPDQELVAGGGHWLPRRGVHQPIRRSTRPDGRWSASPGHAGLPDHITGHLLAHELVQQPLRHQGTLSQ